MACRSCDAEIMFRHTPNGKLMPLNVEPDPAGNVELTEGGVAVVHGQVPLIHGTLYMPHFATCPEGAAWAAGERFDGSTYEPKEDGARLTGHLDKVRKATADGNWWRLADLARAVGCTEAAASARLRDLRKPRFGEQVVERRRVEGGLFEYRVWPKGHREQKKPAEWHSGNRVIDGPAHLRDRGLTS